MERWKLTLQVVIVMNDDVINVTVSYKGDSVNSLFLYISPTYHMKHVMCLQRRGVWTPLRTNFTREFVHRNQFKTECSLFVNVFERSKKK